LQRFGKSGAQLLLLYFTEQPNSLPHVLKVGVLEKVRREFEAFKSVRDFVADATLVYQEVFEAKDSKGEEWGALVFRHQGRDESVDDATRPASLRERFEAGMTAEDLCRHVTRVYQELNGSEQESGGTAAGGHFREWTISVDWPGAAKRVDQDSGLAGLQRVPARN
jgi:hypothetical protein